jgi:hypothetical protein
LEAVRLAGTAGSFERHPEQIEVGAPGLGSAGHPGGEVDVLAIRAEDIVGVVAEGARGHVGVETRGDRPYVGDRGGRQVADEQVVARAVGPLVPVPDEELVKQLPGLLVGGPGVQALLGAGDLIAGAVGEDGDGQGDPLAVRRDAEGADVERQVGDLHGGRALAVGAPDLAGAAARGEEVDRAVGPPAPGGGAAFRGRQAARGEAGGVGDPEGVAAAVGFPVGGAQGVEDAAAVRRDARVGHAVQHDQVAGGEGAGRLGRLLRLRQDGRGQGGEGGDEGAEAKAHGRSVER